MVQSDARITPRRGRHRPLVYQQMSTASRATTSCASESSYASTTASRNRGYHLRVAQPSRRQSQMAAQALSRQPPMYIGPWQEFALGRALQPAVHGRRSGWRRVAVEAAPTDTELNVLVHAFKELASRPDEEGLKNMLRFSPLFMPTMQGLLNPLGGGAYTALDVPPPTMSRHRAQVAVAELQQVAALRVSDSVLPPAAERRRGGAGGGSTVRSQRQQRVQQLQQMYSCGGPAAGAPHAEATEADATHLAPPRSNLPWEVTAERPAEVSVCLSAVQAGAPLPAMDAAAVRALAGRSLSRESAFSPSRPRSRREAMLESTTWSGGGAANLDDEWEDEVDGLLEWTQGLQTLA